MITQETEKLWMVNYSEKYNFVELQGWSFNAGGLNPYSARFLKVPLDLEWVDLLTVTVA